MSHILNLTGKHLMFVNIFKVKKQIITVDCITHFSYYMIKFIQSIYFQLKNMGWGKLYLQPSTKNLGRQLSPPKFTPMHTMEFVTHFTKLMLITDQYSIGKKINDYWLVI